MRPMHQYYQCVEKHVHPTAKAQLSASARSPRHHRQLAHVALAEGHRPASCASWKREWLLASPLQQTLVNEAAREEDHRWRVSASWTWVEREEGNGEEGRLAKKECVD